MATMFPDITGQSASLSFLGQPGFQFRGCEAWSGTCLLVFSVTLPNSDLYPLSLTSVTCRVSLQGLQGLLRLPRDFGYTQRWEMWARVKSEVHPALRGLLRALGGQGSRQQGNLEEEGSTDQQGQGTGDGHDMLVSATVCSDNKQSLSLPVLAQPQFYLSLTPQHEMSQWLCEQLFSMQWLQSPNPPS